MAIVLEELLRSINEKMPDEGISIADLKRPTTEFMMRYFLKVVVELGVADTTQTVLQRIGNPEMYKDIIQYTTIYKIIKKIYPIREHLRGFSILSLMDPKPDDIRYVCYVDSYYDFYYQRTMQLLIPKATEVEELETELERLRNKREELQTKLNMITLEHFEVNKNANQVEDSILSLSCQLEEVKMTNSKKMEEIESLKRKKSSLQQTLNAKWEEVKKITAYDELCKEKTELETHLLQVKEELKKEKEVLIELEQKKADKIDQQMFYKEAVLQEQEFKELLAKLREIYKAGRQSANKISEIKEKIMVLKEQVRENQEKIKSSQQMRDQAAKELRNFHAENKKNTSSRKKTLSSLLKKERESESKLQNALFIQEELKMKAQQLEVDLVDEENHKKSLDFQYAKGKDVLYGKLKIFDEKIDNLLK